MLYNYWYFILDFGIINISRGISKRVGMNKNLNYIRMLKLFGYSSLVVAGLSFVPSAPSKASALLTGALQPSSQSESQIQSRAFQFLNSLTK